MTGFTYTVMVGVFHPPRTTAEVGQLAVDGTMIPLVARGAMRETLLTVPEGKLVTIEGQLRARTGVTGIAVLVTAMHRITTMGGPGGEDSPRV